MSERQHPDRNGERVLHIATFPDGGWDQALAFAAISASQPGRHDLLAIGPTGTRQALLGMGVKPVQVLAPLLGQLLGRGTLASSAVRAFLRDRPGMQYALIHAWSIDAADLARRALGKLRTPVLCTPVRGPRARADLAAVVDATLAPLAHAWSLQGNTPSAIPLPGLPAGFEQAFAQARSRLRNELEIGPDELCVLLLADPPAEASARTFASQVGVMRLADLAAVGLVPAGVGEARRGARHTARHDYVWDLIHARWPAQALLPAADILVWPRPALHPDAGLGADARAGGVLAAHHAALCGIPIVAHDALAERLVASAGGTLTRDWTLPIVAGALVGLTGHTEDGQIQLARAGVALRSAAQANTGDFAGCVARMQAAVLDGRSVSLQGTAVPI